MKVYQIPVEVLESLQVAILTEEPEEHIRRAARALLEAAVLVEVDPAEEVLWEAQR